MMVMVVEMLAPMVAAAMEDGDGEATAAKTGSAVAAVVTVAMAVADNNRNCRGR